MQDSYNIHFFDLAFHAAAAGDFQMQIRFIFENGRQYQIRVHNTVKAGQYEVQSMGDTSGVCITGWKWHKNFSSAQSQKMQSEGVTFRVALEGTYVVAYINGAEVGRLDLSSKVGATETAKITLIMYGNNDQQDMVIPFRSVYKELHADRETGC